MDKENNNDNIQNVNNTENNIEETNDNDQNLSNSENLELEENNISVERNLEEDIKLLKDQLLRAVAEGENIRKRSEKQVEDAAKFAIANFAKDLINIMENLERTTDAITQEVLAENPVVKTISEGIEMTQRELFSVFTKHHINRINPLKGDKFDHNFHQAVANVEDAELESGSIVAVMQAGYVINDRLLRPAIVTVAQ